MDLQGRGKRTRAGMPVTLKGLAAALTLGAILAGGSSATALASAASRVLSGAAPLLASGSTNLGALTETRSITLTLDPSNASELVALDSNPNHPQLSPAQFNERFAPPPATVAAITAWAGVHGLSVSEVSADRLLVTVSGSSQALGKALGVTFERLRTPNGQSYVSSVGTATLPASIAASVKAIGGLSSLARVHTDIVHPSETNPVGLSYPTSYGPKELWSLYNAPSSQTGSGQQLSVITAGDLTQPQADLVTFEKKFGLAAVKWNQIDIGTPSGETEGDDEWDLDTQYSTGFAPGVSQINVYVASSLEDPDIVAAIDRWVSEDKTRQASFSAGECELLAQAGGFIESLDTVLQKAAAQGQTLFVASGDTGSQCPLLVGVNGVPLGLPGVDYPASSPYAIGTGGTTVLGKGEEIGWYAGGGGTSLSEATPSWQQNAGGSFTGLERGVPDVSLDSDPNSGYDVVVGGEVQTVGGTSASAPSWQGIWARTEAAHAGSIGFAGPVIYASEPSSAFTDITLGDNGLYPCTPGWDYVTGRGTPNISAFLAGA